jgi:ATP-binding cassette, subfamily B, multidrug efflux pump
MAENQQKPKESTSRPMMRGPRGINYIEKPQDFKGTMKKLLKYLKPYKLKIITAGTMAIIASVLSVLSPWLLGLITSEVSDAFMESRPMGLIAVAFGLELSLGEITLLIAIIYLLASLFNYFQSFMLIGMTQNLTYSMRRELSQKINLLPLKYFDDQSFGDILGRVTNDVETINGTLTQSISEIFRSIALLIGIFVMMFVLSVPLALIVVLTTILSLWVARKFVLLSQGYFRAQAKSYGELNGHIEETYSGHAVVKVYNHQERSYLNFERINESLYFSSVRSQFISGIMMPMQFFIGNIAYIAIAVVGALLVITTNPILAIKVGVIQAFIQYTRQINQPIQAIGSIATTLQSTAAASERIFGLLNQEDEPAEREDLKTLKS